MHPKVTKHQPNNPWKFHSYWPNHSKVNQHFPKLIITLTTQPLGSIRGASNQKTKICISKNEILGGVCFIKNWQILIKMPPLRCPHPCNPEIGPQPQNQKSALPRLFGLTTAFQNGMTLLGSTNDHVPAPLQGKGQGAGKGLPGGGLGESTTHPKVMQTNLASTENFVQIRSPI